jgi:hypothetical protein
MKTSPSSLRNAGLAALLLLLTACYNRDRKEFKGFIDSLHTAAEEVRKGGPAGTLTLDIKAWESVIVLLPPRSSARDFKLPANVIQELDKDSSTAENSRLYLVRGETITAKEELDETIESVAGFSDESTVHFKIGKSRSADRPVQVTLM